VYLAADLGKSACKFLYWQQGGEIHPLWLSSDLAQGVSDAMLSQFEVSGDLAESAWLKVGEQNMLVGNSAMSYGSSFIANKEDTAAYQIATALGIAAIEFGLSEYRAEIAVALPLNEFRHRANIETQLQSIGADCVVCGQPQRFNATVSFYPEGTGLYILHRKAKESHLGSSYNRRAVVLMLGHRNLSMLVFDRGRLNSNVSQTSDKLGFWSSFKSDATNAGIREAEYSSLMSAVCSGKARQLSGVAGGVKDFTEPMEAVKQGAAERFKLFCQDNLVNLLGDREPTDCLIGGGAAHPIRAELQAYFEHLEMKDELYFADAVGGRLLLLAEQSPHAQADLSRPLRFADVYGLTQLLIGKSNRQR
jgi:hypothetical protein